MKISKLFHWLYACLCFLPLFVIPCFALAVRSDNNFQPISLTIDDSIYQPKYQSNEVNNFDDLIVGNIYELNDIITQDNEATGIINFYLISGNFQVTSTLDEDLLDINSFTYNNNIEIDFNINPNGDNVMYIYPFYDDYDCYYSYIFDDLILNNCIIKLINCYDVLFSNFSYTSFNVYDYVESTPIVYNDTDVGSQLLYTLYVTTDKYLNFDDVLNLKLINEWININVFNNNAPLVWTIIWHYLDYWLLLSIFWLCFDVLIYVPQLAHRWLDKASLE